MWGSTGKAISILNIYCLKNSSYLSSSVLRLYTIQTCQCFYYKYMINVFLKSFSP